MGRRSPKQSIFPYFCFFVFTSFASWQTAPYEVWKFVFFESFSKLPGGSRSTTRSIFQPCVKYAKICVFYGLHHAPQVIDFEPKWLIAENKCKKNKMAGVPPCQGRVRWKQNKHKPMLSPTTLNRRGCWGLCSGPPSFSFRKALHCCSGGGAPPFGLPV